MSISISPVKSAIGKHKVPKYLYHLTPSTNLPSIEEKGFQITEDPFFGDGFFMMDIPNFLKFWNNNKLGQKMGTLLIESILRRGNDISIIRIPTKDFDINKLSIRRTDILAEVSKKYSNDTQIYRAFYNKEISKTYKDNLISGSPAIFANKFDRKKLPIEYIYEENFKTNYDVIGKTYVKYSEAPDLIGIFKRLLSGQKEELFITKGISEK